MVALQDVTKIYRTGRREVTALDGVTLRVETGEFVVIRGPSGSGKTTLLMIASSMLDPTSGRVVVDGHDLRQLSPTEKQRFRARHIGFIFQMFHLVPYLNVIENVIFAAGAAAVPDASARAAALLEQLGMEHRVGHRPFELSAGEQQRVAIARALLNHPRLLLADEPTGNLDRESAAAVLGHLAGFHRAGGTVILASHQPETEPLADRVVSLAEGKIVQE